MIDVWIMTSAPSRRAWLSGCFDADTSIHVVGSVATLPLLRSSLQESPADVAVVETSNLRDWFSELSDQLPIVVLQPEADPFLSNRILQAGVGGMLRSDASSEQIVLAVKSVAAGMIVLDSNVVMSPGGLDSMPIES